MPTGLAQLIGFVGLAAALEKHDLVSLANTTQRP